jgi:hypothetical protein
VEKITGELETHLEAGGLGLGSLTMRRNHLHLENSRTAAFARRALHTRPFLRTER